MSTEKRVIAIIDDEDSSLFLAKKILESYSYEVDTFKSFSELSAKVEIKEISDCYDLVVSDVRMPRMSGIEVLKKIKTMDPKARVLLMTSYSGNEEALEAIQLGAIDYIAKPFDSPQVFGLAIHKALYANGTPSGAPIQKKQQNVELTEKLDSSSPEMQKVLKTVAKVSHANVSIFINGETGSGKEVLAKHIHQLSKREGSFIALNCSAIPAELIESELFGHVKGSFTGADKTKIGLIELAQNGTLFLDEIGDLDMNLQTKLLRFLQERKVRKVGGDKEIDIHTRILSATHKNIEQLIKEGKFREDLFYRLNTIKVKIPALRDRKEDLASLTEHFLNELTKKYESSENITLSEESFQLLNSYSWPGNIRQLKSVLERSFLLSETALIESLELGDSSSEEAGEGTRLNDESSEALAVGSTSEDTPVSITIPLGLPLEEVEMLYMQEMLRIKKFNKSQTAESLGIGLRTLYRKLEKFEVGMSLE